jgi:hypothetical protein
MHGHDFPPPCREQNRRARAGHVQRLRRELRTPANLRRSAIVSARLRLGYANPISAANVPIPKGRTEFSHPTRHRRHPAGLPIATWMIVRVTKDVARIVIGWLGGTAVYVFGGGTAANTQSDAIVRVPAAGGAGPRRASRLYQRVR